MLFLVVLTVVLYLAVHFQGRLTIITVGPRQLSCTATGSQAERYKRANMSGFIAYI